MKKYLFHIALPALALSLLTTSCNDWLDVRGENIQKEQDQYDTYKGFRDALVGCYMTMGDENIYGEKLTMTDIENLADNWYCTSSYETGSPLQYELTNHQYDKDEARAAIKTMYGNLFTTISSANVLLKGLTEKGGNIPSTTTRDMIEGEALAIRAFCQLDVLRLFGQLPQGGTKKVSLPYSYTTSIDEMPKYYDFDAYVANLTADIEKAETLLKTTDPVMSSKFSELNSSSSSADDFLNYRQSRLNYWAVRALHARMDLYIGKTKEAHDIAMEIINAKNSDGSAVMALSGMNNLHNGYNALPGESLFYLSKYDVNTYANKLLIGGNNSQAGSSTYVLSQDMLADLFASIPNATASHNRYIYLWNRNCKNAFGTIMPALKKYWYDEDEASSYQLTAYYQIVPLIRLSEMYLIAMETTTSLEEALSLYKTYMTDREFTLYTPFTSLDEVKTEIVNEYRREFIGEGQMFYVYKRLNKNKMKWNDSEITEDNYILPLPSSEYDPDQK